MKKKIFIVVLTWNRRDLVNEALESIYKTISKHEFKIIVVDNASKDDTVKFIKDKYSTVTLLVNKDNLGWSGGNNRAIKYSLRKKADYIILLNNDVTIESNFVDRMISEMEKNDKIGIAGPKIYRSNTNPAILSNAGNFFTKDYQGNSRGGGKIDTGHFNKVIQTDYVAGIVCAKAEVYRKVGLLDESYFLYFEDADYSIRARECGFLLIYVPDAIQYHRESATIGVNSPSHVYYNVRNHLLFVEKHVGIKILLIQLYLTTRLMASKIYHRDKNSVFYFHGLKDYFFRRFGNRQYW